MVEGIFLRWSTSFFICKLRDFEKEVVRTQENHKMNHIFFFFCTALISLFLMAAAVQSQANPFDIGFFSVAASSLWCSELECGACSTSKLCAGANPEIKRSALVYYFFFFLTAFKFIRECQSTGWWNSASGKLNMKSNSNSNSNCKLYSLIVLILVQYLICYL